MRQSRLRLIDATLDAADARMRAMDQRASIADQGRPPGSEVDVEIAVGPVVVGGRLSVPAGARGLVIFAHGSGSSRHSPRNQFVASVLNRAGLATLLFDLLTADEESIRSNVFDISLLAGRLLDVSAWARHHEMLIGLKTGYFGASTGAAAALWAAAAPDSDVGAVVSRGGRPDLAGDPEAEVDAASSAIITMRNGRIMATLLCQSRPHPLPCCCLRPFGISR